MKTPETLFLAWQDYDSRSWFTIGKLTFDGKNYKFVYTKGVEEAQNKCGFEPLYSFPNLEQEYTSTYLFAVFANRVMSRSRPDYADFIQRLNIPENEDDPLAILARSGGQRKTDNLAVFPCAEPDEEGRYQLHFLAHGLRHLPECALERINSLSESEKLWLAHEFQNPYDDKALTLNTEDHYIVGYCPRYLRSEVFELLRKDPKSVILEVERVNLSPTPLQFRLLCRLTAVCQDNFRPFSSWDYQPLVEENFAQYQY
ncbi:MAG TPA: HIRAN domain-containing protein [Nostocaceae cyanobacterium]|nr:HIRAN domain-containing protein [Nostocaceae cyanobacterium]